MSETTAVAKPAGPLQNLADLLKSKQEALMHQLPAIGGKGGEANARRLIKIALQACSRNPTLLECSRESIYGTLMQCAELGLEPSPYGGAHLVPYRNNKTGKMEAQFQPDYRGLVKLARRSGEIASITANVVHQKDTFEYGITEKGPHLKHVPSLDPDPGPMTHAYMVAVLKDGTSQIEVLTKAEVDKVRAVSKAKSSGPWVDWYEAMARKTAIKRGCKLLPLSTDLIRAVELDNRAETEEPIVYRRPDDVGLAAASGGAIPIAQAEEVSDDELLRKQQQAAAQYHDGGDGALTLYEDMTTAQRVEHWTGLLDMASDLDDLAGWEAQLKAKEPDAKGEVRSSLRPLHAEAKARLQKEAR